MKQLTRITIFILVLILGFAVYDNSQLNNTIKHLRNQAKAKKYERHGISIGDSTLHFTTSLTIQNKPYKYLHIKRLKPGQNKFYFVLTEGVGVDLIINKYE